MSTLRVIKRMIEEEHTPSKRYLKPGEFFWNKMPHSEVCMHMQIADKRMLCQIVPENPRLVQLYADGDAKQVFSAPILLGEAGVYTDSRGSYIYEQA